MELFIYFFKSFLLSQTTLCTPTASKYILKELFLLVNRYGSKSRTRSVCIFTGRTRSVYRKEFNATRMQVKERTKFGSYLGVRKSSW
jgi:ribosomal protein S14